MQRVLVLSGLLAVYFALEVMVGGFLGPSTGLAWSALLAIVFVAAAAHLASPSSWFVGLSVLFVSAVWPLALLVAVALPSAGSTEKAISVLAAHLAREPWESALQFLLPLSCTLAAIRVLKRPVRSK
jgi:hypothetical protein